MDGEQVLVAWEGQGGGKRLGFRFPAELTTEAATEAIRMWREAVESTGREPVTLVWDCRIMKGYSSDARRAWQDALQEMKIRTGTVWLVSGSPFVRLGAMLMGKALSIEIKSVDSPDAIRS